MGQQFPRQNFGQPFPGQNLGQQFPGQGYPFPDATNFPGQVFPNPNFPRQFPGQSLNGQGFHGQGYNGLNFGYLEHAYRGLHNANQGLQLNSFEDQQRHLRGRSSQTLQLHERQSQTDGRTNALQKIHCCIKSSKSYLICTTALAPGVIRTVHKSNQG